MRVLLKILAWTLGIVVVLVTAVLIYLRNADLNTYESLIEQALSDAIGLQVDFNGRFELRFGRVTTITAENVSLINPEVATNSRVLNISAFDMSLQTLSLIRRPIVIESLAIGGAAIDLHRGPDGRGNWQGRSAPDTVTVRDTEDEPPNVDIVVFRRIDLDRVSFVLDEPERSKPVRAFVQSLTVIPDAGGMLDIEVDGTIGDYALVSAGEVGPLAALISGNDVSVDIQTSLALMELSLTGSVGDLRTLQDLSLSVAAVGPEIQGIIDAFVLPPFAEGAFSVIGSVSPGDDGNDVSIEGNIGSIELSLGGSVDDLLQPSEAALDYRFSGPESAYIAGLFGIDDASRAAFDVSGGFGLRGERYALRNLDVAIGESRLAIDGWVEPGEGLPELDLEIRGNGPNLAVFDPFVELDGIPAAAYDIDGRLMRQGDAWHFENLAVAVGEVRLTANGRVDGPGSQDNRIVFNVAGPDLSVFREITGVAELPAIPFDASGDLRGARGGIRIDNAEASIDGNIIDAGGFLSTAENAVGTELDLRVQGPGLSNIAALAEIPNLPTGEFDISGHVRVAQSELQLSAITAKFDDLTLDLAGTIDHDSAEPTFNVDVDVAGQDLSAVLPESPLDRLGHAPWRVYGNFAGSGHLLDVNDLHALVDNVDIELDASLDLSDLQASDRVEILAAAPDATLLRTLADLPHVPDGPLLVAVNVEASSSTYRISDSTIQIGDFGFDLDAEVGKTRPYSGNDVSAFFDGPSLREIGLMFGDPFFADEAFSLEAHLDGTERGFVMDTFEFKVGVSEIGGAVSADVSGERPAIDISLDSPLVDLRDRIPRLLEDADGEDPALEPVEQEAGGGRVFSDEPLDLPWRHLADLRVNVGFDRLLLPTGELTDFRFDLDMVDGNVIVERLAVTSPQGGVDGKFSLTEERGVFSVSAILDVEDVRPPVLAADGLDPLTVPPIDVDVKFDGSGESLHDILGGGDGHVFILIEEGQVAVFGSEFFSGGLIQGIARTINPLARSRTYTQVDCGIANIDITDGLADFRQVAIQSQQLTVVSSGTINLDSERLRLIVRTFPREGLSFVSLSGIVNPFIRVAGTLKSPVLEIDPASSATSAGVAVATGGLSVLARGVWDRIRGGSDICRNLPTERPEESRPDPNR